MATRRSPVRHPLESEALMQRVVALCHERRAEDVVVLDVRGLVDYMDYMVIGTGRSQRQNHAVAEHVLASLKRDHRVLPLSVAGLEASTWICVDLVDVVLHVFEPASRAHYDLELLWADAKRSEHPAPPAPEAPRGLDDDAVDADAGAPAAVESDEGAGAR